MSTNKKKASKGRKSKGISLTNARLVFEELDKLIVTTPSIRLLLGERFLQGWRDGKGPGLLFVDPIRIGVQSPLTYEMLEYTRTHKGNAEQVFQPLIDSFQFVSTTWLDQQYGGRRAWENVTRPILHKDLLMHRPASWRLQDTGEYEKHAATPANTFFLVALSLTPGGLEPLAGNNFSFYHPSVDFGMALGHSVLSRADPEPRNKAEREAVEFVKKKSEPSQEQLSKIVTEVLNDRVQQRGATELKMNPAVLNPAGAGHAMDPIVPVLVERCAYSACHFAVVEANTDKFSASARRKLKRCGGCKAVFYCSAECQKADWKTHKRACKLATTKHE